jgi:hypothetical protein
MVPEIIRWGRLVWQSKAAEAKSLKTKGQGTVQLLPTQVTNSRGNQTGASGQNKKPTLMTCLLKKRRAIKQPLAEAQKGRRQSTKEKHHR